MLVVDHPFYIERYNKEFEKLWTQFAAQAVRAEEQAARVIQNSYRNKQARQQNTNNGGKKSKSTSAPGYKFTGW